jgi:nucleotide-binding universal stress UspA family protein
MRTARARSSRLAGAGPDAGDRPVLLVTFFSVPFHPAACELAVGSAVETGQPLTVANIVELPPLPMSVSLGHDHLDDPPETEAALRAPAERARSLGVQVERLLVRSPRPIAALIQLASERRPGLLVLGPEPGRLRARFFRRARRAVREKTGCLVWSADTGEEVPGAWTGLPGSEE